MNWYKIIEIDEVTYCIKEHLHWEDTNIYYLIGDSYNILIDSGTGIAPIKELLESIDHKSIKVLTTHAHWDHIGNHHEFEDVYCHPLEVEWLKESFPLPLPVVKNMMIKDVNQEFLKTFDFDEFKIYQSSSIKTFEAFYDLGNRKLQIIHTPGHSPGHVMIHDATNDYLFTGDHLYEGEIYCHYPSTSPKDFLQSTKDIKHLSHCRLFTGHNEAALNGSCIDTLYELTQSIENVAHGSGLYSKGNFTVHF